MRVSQGEFGGINIDLRHGDSLAAVPETHAELLSDELRHVFRDPIGHMKEVASRCIFPSLRKWLVALAAEGNWTLRLFADVPFWSDAGIVWESRIVRGAFIRPSIETPLTQQYPNDLLAYFSCVDGVDWNGLGAAGSIFGRKSPQALSTICGRLADETIDPSTTFLFGNSPCGDYMIWTSDGRAGWIEIASKQTHLLGSVADTINWVYSELCLNRPPGWKNEWFV